MCSPYKKPFLRGHPPVPHPSLLLSPRFSFPSSYPSCPSIFKSVPLSLLFYSWCRLIQVIQSFFPATSCRFPIDDDRKLTEIRFLISLLCFLPVSFRPPVRKWQEWSQLLRSNGVGQQSGDKKPDSFLSIWLPLSPACSLPSVVWEECVHRFRLTIFLQN